MVMALNADAQAVVRDFTGTFALGIATLDPVVVPGAGTVVVNVSGGREHLTAVDSFPSPFAATGFVLPRRNRT